jgi:hypothetical protein
VDWNCNAKSILNITLNCVSFFFDSTYTLCSLHWVYAKLWKGKRRNKDDLFPLVQLSSILIRFILSHDRVTPVAPWCARRLALGPWLASCPGAVEPVPPLCPVCTPGSPSSAHGWTRPSLPTKYPSTVIHSLQLPVYGQ